MVRNPQGGKTGHKRQVDWTPSGPHQVARTPYHCGPFTPVTDACVAEGQLCELRFCEGNGDGSAHRL